MYSEILDDAKIKRICRKTGNSKALIIGVWTCLLSLANDSPQRGLLIISDDIPYTLDDMEFEMGLPCEVIAQLIDEFKALGMMTGNTTFTISNWEKRQFKSDNSTERVRAYRMKRYGNVIEPDTESESESDTESDTEAAAAAGNHQNIFTLYTENFGLLTPILREKLIAIEKDYPPEWIPRAFTEAVEHNARNLSYVTAILERWKIDGPGGNVKKVVPRGKQAAEDFRTTDAGRRKYAESADNVRHR
jgi:DnaD/phage-associated family protein